MKRFLVLHLAAPPIMKTLRKLNAILLLVQAIAMIVIVMMLIRAAKFRLSRKQFVYAARLASTKLSTSRWADQQ